MKLHVEPLLGASVLGGVLVEHDDDLSHVVELAHQGHVLHGPPPLFILPLHQTPVTQDCQQRVNVRLRGEVETRANMATCQTIFSEIFLSETILCEIFTWRGDAAAVLRVETVHRVLLLTLILSSSLVIINVAQQVSLDLPQQGSADTLGYGQLLIDGHPVLLRYDHVSQVLGVDVQLHRHLPSVGVLEDRPVVLDIILGTVVDVRYLRNIKLVLHAKVLLKFSPASRHQIPSLAVVQHLLVCILLLKMRNDEVQLLDEIVNLSTTSHRVLDVSQSIAD